MNDKVAEHIVDSMDKIQQYIDSTEEFVLEQAPLVAQEIVTLGQMQGALTVVCFVIATLLMSTLCMYCIFKNKDSGPLSDWELPMVFSGIATAGAALGVMVSFSCALVPFFAPRLYLLREVSKLL
jgi:hypothetical protein